MGLTSKKSAHFQNLEEDILIFTDLPHPRLFQLRANFSFWMGARGALLTYAVLWNDEI